MYNLWGSMHDSMAADIGGLYSLVEETVPPDMFILADSAFCHSERIHCTLSRRQELGLSVEDVVIRRAQSRIVSKARVLVEWSIAGLKTTFRQLLQKLEPADMREALMDVCLRLWNYRVRTMGVSEVAKVFTVDEDLAEEEHDPSLVYNLPHAEQTKASGAAATYCGDMGAGTAGAGVGELLSPAAEG
jgi:hypothetical protein